MPATAFFKGPEFGPLSSKDLLSWMFDDQLYASDKQVSSRDTGTRLSAH